MTIKVKPSLGKRGEWKLPTVGPDLEHVLSPPP